MTKQSKQQEIFTPSGHQVDKDLAKIAVKVSPSLQALIANQIDLLEMLEGKVAKNPVLIEQHRVEVLQVEEEIASAFSSHVQKREKAREQRLLKKGNTAVPFDRDDASVPAIDQELAEKSVPGRKKMHDAETREDDRLLEYNMYFDIESVSPQAVLPSAKYADTVQPAVSKPVEVDVRRVALGASIKVLESFLNRALEEEEIKALENQVDLYLT